MPPSKASRTKSHCHRGHPLSGENLRIDPDGGRACRACIIENARVRRAKKRAENPTPMHKLARLRVAGRVAPLVRRNLVEARRRKVTVLKNDGTSTTKSLYEVQQALLVRSEIEFGFSGEGSGERPTSIDCLNCGRTFNVPAYGHVAKFCRSGCPCAGGCGKNIPNDSVHLAYRRGKRAVCRKCARPRKYSTEQVVVFLREGKTTTDLLAMGIHFNFIAEARAVCGIATKKMVRKKTT